MTPKEFRAEVGGKGPRAAYLFVGPDAYQRRICQDVLLQAFLPETDRESGITRHYLDEVPLAAVLDDARSMTLFASRRVIFASSAEGALPRTLKKSEDESQQMLAAYLNDPPEATVLVFECTRFAFDGDDKSKIERVQKYFSAVKAQVEFRPLDEWQAAALANQLASKAGVRLAADAARLLVEETGSDAERIRSEMEKLSLFAGKEPITVEMVTSLCSDSRSDSIFSLVNALARRDGVTALESLDLLVRQGEYLPLALSFLSTQVRLATAIQEAGLRNRQQVIAYFKKLGIPMWPSRADQVLQTAEAFGREQIVEVLGHLAAADLALRSARPDDRTVMEAFVLRMTEAGKKGKAGQPSRGLARPVV